MVFKALLISSIESPLSLGTCLLLIKRFLKFHMGKWKDHESLSIHTHTHASTHTHMGMSNSLPLLGIKVRSCVYVLYASILPLRCTPSPTSFKQTLKPGPQFTKTLRGPAVRLVGRPRVLVKSGVAWWLEAAASLCQESDSTMGTVTSPGSPICAH